MIKLRLDGLSQNTLIYRIQSNVLKVAAQLVFLLTIESSCVSCGKRTVVCQLVELFTRIDILRRWAKLNKTHIPAKNWSKQVLHETTKGQIIHQSISHQLFLFFGHFK